jgi:hypothetical protein
MNSTVQRMNSMVALPANSVKNLTKATNSVFGATPATNTSSWNTPLIWFMGLFIVGLIVFSYYYRNFVEAVDNMTQQFNQWLTGTNEPVQVKEDNLSASKQDKQPNNGMNNVVDKLLPPAKEVFTVSKNDYSYYDAAPLCKALGAELATYDQVKEAWQQGADWCNYGWVKGQMAVYPTQKSTYDDLQGEPGGQKAACGKPGVNGGYFDNPELKFGVTCVGKKPPQGPHDSNAVIQGSTTPLTASGIEFEKQVLKFKNGSETIGILPFNKDHWGS